MASVSLIGACLWVILASILGALPSKDRHKQSAVFLILTGVPILALVVISNGPWIGLLVFAGGASILRWPLIHFGRGVLARINRIIGHYKDRDEV